MRILVTFGGKSVEHDISVLTGLHLAKHISPHHRVHLCHITPDGDIEVGAKRGKLSRLEHYESSEKSETKRAWGINRVNGTKPKFGGVRRVLRLRPDVVVNCCHGGAGEDGRLFAFFEALGIPMTSCPTRTAIELQSKSRTREILSASGFKQPKWVTISTVDEIPTFNDVQSPSPSRGVSTNNNGALTLPVIVKPDTLGSSIGISVAKNADELHAAVEAALLMDTRVIIEEFLQDAEEVNCASLKRGAEVLVSACEVIKKGGEMLDYSAKYIDQDSGFIKSPAKKSGGNFNKTDHKDEAQIKDLTKKAYEIFGARGVIRADFLIAGGEIYLNEINTVPGFMAYHLWLKTGLPYTALIEMMITGALSQPQNRLVTDFKSEILAHNKSLI